jgi:hypothetical protein
MRGRSGLFIVGVRCAMLPKLHSGEIRVRHAELIAESSTDQAANRLSSLARVR